MDNIIKGVQRKLDNDEGQKDIQVFSFSLYIFINILIYSLSLSSFSLTPSCFFYEFHGLMFSSTLTGLHLPSRSTSRTPARTGPRSSPTTRLRSRGSLQSSSSSTTGRGDFPENKCLAVLLCIFNYLTYLYSDP